MADRTVRVVLTGTVTPYQAAMRQAARVTQQTAGQIAASTRAGTQRAQASLTSMARAAQVQSGRASAAVNGMAQRASASMSRMGARGAAAFSPISAASSRAAAQVSARWQAATQAVQSRIARTAAAARTGGALMGAGLASGADRVALRWNAVLSATQARFPRLAALATAAGSRAAAGLSAGAGAVASRWSAASSAVAARWQAAMAAVGRGAAGVQGAAGAGAAAVSARWSAAAGAVAARWRATSAAVTGSMAAARTAAGTAAGWVAARWSAAAAATGRALGSMHLAAVAAGAGIMGVATNGTRALKAVRLASLGLVGAFVAAALAAANFEKGMSEVRAVTDGSAAEMRQLSQAALDAGNATKYSASEAANAEAELARAGVSTADIIGGALKGSLDLAASGQLELGESAIISAQAMNAFGLKGADVAHIADVISAGAGKSATNVHDMGMAFRQSALLANQTGLSLEDTVGTLAMFAQNALTGSDAGTSLKVMLQRLTPQSNEAQAAMDAVGFSAYDSQGDFVGLSEMAQRLHDSFGSLTPEARNAAFATIFGSDAVRAATILYQAGAIGVDTWRKAVSDSGYATRVAATMTDNLAGDYERLTSALTTGLISSGSAANGMLRGMTQALTSAVNWYNQLSPSAQRSVTAVVGIVGAVGLAGSALLLMLPRIMAVRRELVAMGLTAARARAAMMMLGKVGLVVGALAAVKVGVDSLGRKLLDAPPNVTRLTNSLVDLAVRGKAAGEVADAFGKNLDGFGDAVKRITDPEGLTAFTDALGKVPLIGGEAGGLTEAKDKVNALDEALSQMVQSGSADVAQRAFSRLAAEAEKQGVSVNAVKGLLPQYTDALAGADTQAKLSAQGQKSLGDQAAMTKEQFEDQRTEAEKLTDALNALNGVNIGAAQDEIAFQASLHSLTEAVKDNGHSLDVTSEKGRAVKSAFLDAAKAAMTHAQSVAEQKGSVAAGNAVLEQNIAALKRTMRAAGFTEPQIRQLTAAYAQLPSSKTTDVKANTTKAIQDLQQVQNKVRNTKGKEIPMRALTGAAEAALKRLGFKVTHMKDGSVRVSVPPGPPSVQVARIQSVINGLQGRTVTVSIFKTTYVDEVKRNTYGPYADGYRYGRARGGPVPGYAGGGDVQAFPQGGYVRGPGTSTSDSILGLFAAGPAMVSDTEYVVRASAVRRYGLPLLDAINAERLPKFAQGGVPGFAGGGFTYQPTGGVVMTGEGGDPKARYDTLMGKLKEAYSEYQTAVAELNKIKKGKHTKAQLKAAQNKANKELADVKALDKQLGLPSGAKPPSGFSLAAYRKQLDQSLAATNWWKRNLDVISKRGGQDIRELLEGMGSEGYALVEQLAKASDKQFKDIVGKLQKVGGVAKATLADFTKQLDSSTSKSQQFASDLQTLAARGFGDLAAQLAAQGDATAMDLAHQAVTGKASDVAAANKAVGKNGKVLTGEELSASLTVLAALRSKAGAGIADVIGAGVDFSTLKTLIPKMLSQINKLPDAYKKVFLAQWAGQGGVTAMARGGILTRPTAVLAAEAGAVESWIPVDGSARSQGLLSRTAGLMGYQLVPAGRYGAARSEPSTVVREIARHTTVNLHGAKQSSAAQAADIARHLTFVG
ncbi:phage tail tape measure protein [Streptomyces sp. NPDC052496]|uniref:phage tail tape measure protein n=1 Tax=Streptomyces sp. NPDC052496 TaxID=3154951 RepID=UPI003422CAFE